MDESEEEVSVKERTMSASSTPPSNSSGLLFHERSVSAPTTPTSNPSRLLFHNRKKLRVRFPEDNRIVTDYFEAPNPFECLGKL